MSWFIRIPPSDAATFDATVDRAVEAARLAPDAADVRRAVAVATTALKRLIRAWPVVRPGRLFAATLAGHANPNGDAPAGSANDRITIDLWRAG